MISFSIERCVIISNVPIGGFLRKSEKVSSKIISILRIPSNYTQIAVRIFGHPGGTFGFKKRERIN